MKVADHMDRRRDIAEQTAEIAKSLSVLALRTYTDGTLSRGEADTLVRASKLLWHVHECCELEVPKQLRAAA